MDDRYLTIEKPSIEQIKVKGSRFIAQTIRSDSVEQAQSELELIRKREYAATHNCYAYIVGTPEKDVAFKYSDDGEPSGTAGRPIYNIISGSGITNVLLVVTRYFGGTKLGTGGLVRAYSESARLALEHSGVRENFLIEKLKVDTEFSAYDSLLKAIHRMGAREIKADFSDRVSIQIEIRRSKADLMIAEIVELSRGKAIVEKIR